MTQDYRRFLRPEELSRISRLEVRARQIVEGFLTGMHRSPYFGQSVEFVQHREYAPGDDTRRLDWKVWSKTDKYYIKLFEEETNLRTTILVDISESMQFGTGAMTKYEYAATIAAALGYLLLKQQDSVGMISFDESIRIRIPTRSKKNHLLSLLESLGAENPQKKTEMFNILRQVAEEQIQKGMVIVISDFFAERDSLFKGLNMLRHRGHDVMLFHVLDDQELDFEYAGTTKFIGMEEMGELRCDPKSLREGYQKAMTNYLDRMRKFCAQSMIDYQMIRTSEHLDAAIAHYLTHRVGLHQSVRK